MEIERLFYDDIKGKKRIASGIHKRKGKRGYVGKLYLTSDLLKGKAKKDYQNTSKVVAWNMYDEICSWEEFTVLPDEMKKKYLEEYRKRFTNRQVQDKWGLNDYEFYTKLIKRLGVKTNRSGRKVKGKAVSIDNSQNEPVVESEPEQTFSEGIQIKFSGLYNSDKIQNRLEKLALMLEDETSYFIDVVIREE